jgi:acetyl esterase
MMRWYEMQYSNQGEHLSNPYAFPALRKDFKDVTPAVIVTAEYDTLADDGRHYAMLLSQSGVQVIFKEFEGAIHGFNALAGIAPEIAFEAQTFLAQKINEILER